MNTARGRIASSMISRCRRSRPYLTALAIVLAALSPMAPFAIDSAVGDECAPGTMPGPATGCSVASDVEFRNVRRAGDINAGPDLGGTGQAALDFTGSAGAAGDTWITVLDGGSFTDEFILLHADVLIHRFNNRKGAGLLALFNEQPADRGLALILYDNGNTDALVLATVDSTGQLTKLASVPLGAGIVDNVWYSVTMTVQGSGDNVKVFGDVFRHTDPSDPNSSVDVDGQVGSTLTFSGPRPPGLQPFGEVGIIASAVSAVVDSSVTNFEVAIP